MNVHAASFSGPAESMTPSRYSTIGLGQWSLMSDDFLVVRHCACLCIVKNLDNFRNSSLLVLVLRFSELVKVFTEILKFTLFSKEIWIPLSFCRLVATYNDLHRKDSFPCGVIGTNRCFSIVSCGCRELAFLLLFRRFSLPSFLSSTLH